MEKSIAQANGDLPAYQTEEINGVEYKGLTKREAMAMAAIQGLLSGDKDWNHDRKGPNAVAVYATRYADALLEELSKPTTN